MERPPSGSSAPWPSSVNPAVHVRIFSTIFASRKPVAADRQKVVALEAELHQALPDIVPLGPVFASRKPVAADRQKVVALEAELHQALPDIVPLGPVFASRKPVAAEFKEATFGCAFFGQDLP